HLPFFLGLAPALLGEPALAFLLGLALLFLGELALALFLRAARLLGLALLLGFPPGLLDRDLRIGLRGRGLRLRLGLRRGRRRGLRLRHGLGRIDRRRRRPELGDHRRRLARLPGHADYQHGQQAQVDEDRESERLQPPRARRARPVREAVRERGLVAHRPSGLPSSPTRSTLARFIPSSTNITASYG